jgi:hypothetical protein
MKLPLEEYEELVDRVRDRIRLHVPPGSVVLVASKGDEALVQLDGYRAWHFPQTETGVYAGHYPADSAAAIGHLADLQSCGLSISSFHGPPAGGLTTTPISRGTSTPFMRHSWQTMASV